MSIFSKDLIQREINYRVDPDENMCFQITRMFNKVCDWYDPSCGQDPVTQIRKWMGAFMEDLRQNFWRKKPILPPWWEGDFKYFDGWRVINIHLTNGITGIQVMWKYVEEHTWNSIDLLIDVARLTQKYKNWVL